MWAALAKLPNQRERHHNAVLRSRTVDAGRDTHRYQQDGDDARDG
jgi:hypothetical protein